MPLRKYFSSLVSSHRPPPPEFPTEAHLEELRRFWKATFEESLDRGDEYRAAAITRMHSQQELLSATDVWDIQTMHDGLIVEREELSGFAHSPEKLSFEVVSRASQYKSRAKSLYVQVREAAEQSHARLERARGCRVEQMGDGFRARELSDDFDSASADVLPRSSSQSGSTGSQVPELCYSPTDSDLSSCPDMLPDPVPSEYSTAELLLESPWDFPVAGPGKGGYRPYSRRVPSMLRGYGTLHDRVLCFQPLDQCTACHVVSHPLPPSHLSSHDRRSTQSGCSEPTISSLGPATPNSSPQSSTDLSSSPTFFHELDEALRELDALIHAPKGNPTRSIPHSRDHPVTSMNECDAATCVQHDNDRPSFPFRPLPEVRRSFTSLSEPRRRQREPLMLTKEALAQLCALTDGLESPARFDTDDEDDYEDSNLFMDDCTVEVASVVVQPYGHSRSNTLNSVSF